MATTIEDIRAEVNLIDSYSNASSLDKKSNVVEKYNSKLTAMMVRADILIRGLFQTDSHTLHSIAEAWGTGKAVDVCSVGDYDVKLYKSINEDWHDSLDDVVYRIDVPYGPSIQDIVDNKFYCICLCNKGSNYVVARIAYVLAVKYTNGLSKPDGTEFRCVWFDADQFDTDEKTYDNTAGHFTRWASAEQVRTCIMSVIVEGLRKCAIILDALKADKSAIYGTIMRELDRQLESKSVKTKEVQSIGDILDTIGD